MKKLLILLLTTFGAQSMLFATSRIQVEVSSEMPSDTIKTKEKKSEVVLTEVTVEAARVVQKPDGQVIFPSKKQCETSNNGYSLLAKLALPRLRVDEMMHTITALNNKGEVQIRINGALASKDEMISLNPVQIKSIEFVDNPSIRYGENVGYVLNIRTLKATYGGVVGINLSNSLTAVNGDHTAYAKLNRGNSEFSLSYNFAYQDFKGNRTTSKADYLLNDGTHYIISRNDISARTRFFMNGLQLKYSLADSASYHFQAAFSTDFSNTPNADKTYNTLTPTAVWLSELRTSDHSFTPTLDLFYYHKLGKTASLTANVVGTAIRTKENNYHKEELPYIYKVDGRMRSLYTELIYEQNLRPVTLSAGMKGTLKRIENTYTGDVQSLNKMDYSTFYTFVEVKGKWAKLSYMTGVGLTNARYKQSDAKYNYSLFRPKISLNYALTPSFAVKYSFETYEHISRIAMISNTKIRENSREWRVGNPNIVPNRVVAQSINFSYTLPRFYNMVDVNLRINSNPNMSKYIRTEDDQFYYMQANQKSIKMFYVSDYFNFKIIPDVLEITLSGGIYRFLNKGDDYKHYLTSYNFQANVNAYLGRWVLTAYADNGWKFCEGESQSHSGSAIYVGGSYQVGNLQLSLYLQNPFMQHPKMEHSYILNRYVNKESIVRGSQFGNLINFNLAWKLEFGHRKHNGKDHQMRKDKDTGIM